MQVSESPLATLGSGVTLVLAPPGGVSPTNVGLPAARMLVVNMSTNQGHVVKTFIVVKTPFSGGRRNALVFGEELSEFFARGVVAQALAGAVVELVLDGLELGGGVLGQVGALGQVLP